MLVACVFVLLCLSLCCMLSAAGHRGKIGTQGNHCFISLYPSSLTFSYQQANLGCWLLAVWQAAAAAALMPWTGCRLRQLRVCHGWS
jgi:hypothetical protein